MTDSPEIAALKSALENVKKASAAFAEELRRYPNKPFTERQRRIGIGFKRLSEDLRKLIVLKGRPS